jgi:hypothetical protein
MNPGGISADSSEVPRSRKLQRSLRRSPPLPVGVEAILVRNRRNETISTSIPQLAA